MHHVIGYFDPNGASAALDAADPGPGYTCFGGPGFSTTGILTAWAPGARGSDEAEGIGIKLQKNPALSCSCTIIRVRSRRAIKPRSGFASPASPVKKELLFFPLEDRGFKIPAGTKRFEVTESILSPFNVHLVSIAPHMHLLGREIGVEMTRFGGQPE